MTGLDQVVRESERAWEEAGGGDRGRALMSPFIGNHDVPRFISEAAGDDVDHPIESPPSAPDRDEPYQRLILAQALVMTLPGAPVLYYGDEFGMPGATDPDNRRPMLFDDELSSRELTTLETVRRLGRLRACLVALRRGDRRTVFVDDDVYVFMRDAHDDAPALIVLNRSEQSRTLSIELDEAVEGLAEDRFVDVLSGVEAPVDETSLGPVEVLPLSAMVFVPSDSSCARP
jgi:glycosidase